MAGGTAFTLIVNGSNFASNAVVQWNGSSRTTTYVSASQVTAAIPSADIATAGTISVTVSNPSSGLVSGPATFTIYTGSAWLDPAWNYRRAITISNPGGTALSDFQVHVPLDSSFDYTKAGSNGSDIRFTGSDAVTPMPFWIESWDANGKSASIWVRIPTIPANGTTLYLYYGNSAANPASNGTTTFDFFDDFSVDTAKWTASGGSWVITTDTLPTGSAGKVVKGTITNTLDVLLSSYTGANYVLEGYGKLLGGRIWGLGVRTMDKNNLYSANLYADLDSTDNLYEYS